MEIYKTRFVEIVSYFFILLFCYAAISKIIDFENFQIQIGQSPLLSAFAGTVSYGILILELFVSLLLIFDKSRIFGLYCSFTLMVLFTIYIYMILNYSENVPCSCGGILEKMGWRSHLVFNVITVFLSSIAILINDNTKKRQLFKSVLLQFLLVILSAVTLIIVHRKSEYSVRKENNFTRIFLQHAISEESRFDLKYNTFYFSGITNDSIYLGNYTTPFSIISLNNKLDIMKEKQVVLDHYDFNFKRVKILINVPYYYMYDGSIPIIYKGILGQSNLSIYSNSQAYFSQLVNIDQNTFAFSTYHAPLKIQSLGLLFPKEEKHLELKPDLLKKFTDGVFDTDGQLHYDCDNQRLVYVHNYKNQFLVLDKKLNIIGDYKTIDTISRPQIEVGQLSDGRRKMKKPPLKVNLSSTASYGLLFNESNLMGKHENQKRWEKSAIVDVYSTTEQNYIGSFYIPKTKETDHIQFEIRGDYLFVLVGNEIVKYRFAENISQHFRKGEAENLTKE